MTGGIVRPSPSISRRDERPTLFRRARGINTTGITTVGGAGRERNECSRRVRHYGQSWIWKIPNPVSRGKWRNREEEAGWV